MSVAVIVLASLACWIISARALYARWRPSALPVNCDDHSTYHTHWERCYRRQKALMIDTKGEAVTFALGTSLLWPVVLLCLGLSFLVRVGQPETREELEARIAELEREAGIS